MPADGGWDFTLILLTWRILWVPNNASRWQMGFNSAFKVVILTFYTAKLILLAHRVNTAFQRVMKYIQIWTSCAGRVCKWRCFLYVSHVTGPGVDIIQTQMCCCQLITVPISNCVKVHITFRSVLLHTLYCYLYHNPTNVENMVSS